MKRCLQLAKNGIGTARPNPSVGAVIVLNDRIIGEGFTSPYGGPHAEVNAIKAVKNQELLKKATLYVTLEPCSHYGKTPPCSDLIIEKQIPNIVIGCLDTNSLVAGKGIKKLKKAGRKVVVGVLENECKIQLKRFFTYHNKKRPYIVLKWAKTQNGFIAPLTKSSKKPVWISNKFSRQLVHKWRTKEHSILVGTNTVLDDNPKLTVRSWSGNNPIRIVLDKNLRIPKTANVFDKSAVTIVFTCFSNKNIDKLNVFDETKPAKIFYEWIDFSKNIAQQICNSLYKLNVQSVLIEGGRQTLQTFIDANLWDEARVFTGNTKLESGIKEPIINTGFYEKSSIKDDFLCIYRQITNA